MGDDEALIKGGEAKLPQKLRIPAKSRHVNDCLEVRRVAPEKGGSHIPSLRPRGLAGTGGGRADVAVEPQTDEAPDVEVIDVRRGRFPTPLT